MTSNNEPLRWYYGVRRPFGRPPLYRCQRCGHLGPEPLYHSSYGAHLCKPCRVWDRQRVAAEAEEHRRARGRGEPNQGEVNGGGA